jgi:hypothetical protein
VDEAQTLLDTTAYGLLRSVRTSLLDVKGLVVLGTSLRMQRPCLGMLCILIAGRPVLKDAQLVAMYGFDPEAQSRR